jgi:nickel-dependent lactate racemase
MAASEYSRILPKAILARYPVSCHDCDQPAGLTHLGRTARGTPVWVNRQYLDADLRIVVGNIEPHQFQGFSGGVKSAAIGLAGRETIEHNHALMTDPRSRLGVYEDNPARQDVEAIGGLIRVHFALNAILTENKEIASVIAGSPEQVLFAGIPISLSHCQVVVEGPYDLVIASPGGHPKDINLYQAQKGFAHAALLTKDDGVVLLAAACPEGSGSKGFESWAQQATSYDEVIARFKQERFQLGPHKAFQIARDAKRVRLLLVSTLDPEQVRRWLITPAADVQSALDKLLPTLPAEARVGIMPRANRTIPQIKTNQ